MDKGIRGGRLISEKTDKLINQQMTEDINEILELVEAMAEMWGSHPVDYNNPHKVTKEQVGLGSVDNTSDMDKPVSSATISAIETLRVETQSAINTFKEESSVEITEINRVIGILQTDISQAEQLIETLKNETNTALADKADSIHNHDRVYLKPATADNKYSAKNHSHALTNLTGILPASNGGTGRNDGLSTGIKDRTVIDEDNWLTDNTSGTYSFFWQTADWKAKKLPNIVGSILQNNFTSSFKNALALDYAGKYAGIYDFKSNSWNKLAFDKDVINKMPKATSSSGIGKFQQVVGQGTPVSYRLPNGGTYLYFFSCTHDYNNYSAVDNKAGIAAGGTEIISTSMNLKTFGGFIWRIQ